MREGSSFIVHECIIYVYAHTTDFFRGKLLRIHIGVLSGRHRSEFYLESATCGVP